MLCGLTAMNKFNLTIFALACLMTLNLIATSYSQLVSSKVLYLQGSIVSDDPSIPIPGLTLKYSTDFETATSASSSRLNLAGGFQNRFNFDGTASKWVEGLERTTNGITPHSGTRCIGAETSGNGYRVEFVIYPRTVGVGDTFYIREWLYLPADWSIAGGGWYGILQASDNNPPNWHPYYQCLIYKTSNPALFNMMLNSRDVSGYYTESYQTKSNFALPRGQWFKFEWYEVRATNNQGSVKCWINGQVIFDKSGLTTKYVDDYQVETMKIYGDPGTYQLWVDDFELWG